MGPQELIWAADLVLLAAMTAVGFLGMGLDKGIARKNGARSAQGKATRRRVPERTLFLIAALGGSLGVLLGMYTLVGVPAILAAQLALGWLVVTRLMG
mgnify:CR=1 FL=1